VLETAERIGSLISLAEQWQNSVVAFRLPGEEDSQHGYQDVLESDAIMFSIPTQTAPEQTQYRNNHTRAASEQTLYRNNHTI
jgi:hypothetical protein